MSAESAPSLASGVAVGAAEVEADAAVGAPGASFPPEHATTPASSGVTFLTWFPFDSTNPNGRYADWSWELGSEGRTFRGKPAEQLIIDKFGGQ